MSYIKKIKYFEAKRNVFSFFYKWSHMLTIFGTNDSSVTGYRISVILYTQRDLVAVLCFDF